MPLTSPGPSAAMIATASRKYGKAISVSIDRMMSWSTQRPMKPARSPQSEPASAASAVAVSPTTREIRAPKRSRLRRSRPNSSVPSRWPGVRIGKSRRAVSMASGSRGAIHGARTARHAIAITSARPNKAEPLRRKIRAISVIADARIEDGVEKIDDEIDHDEGRRDQQHPTLHQRIVPRLDGAHHHGAESRQGEDRLREDGPPEEKAHLQPEHRDDRIDRVLEHMTGDDGALRQTFRARRADVVLPDDLEHARAGDTRQSRR